MRRYQLAFLIATVIAAGAATAAVYLWFHPRAAEPGRVTSAPATPQQAPAATPQSSEPQLLPVQLTPQRLQSIGITTGIVTLKQIHDEIRTTGSVGVDETRLSHVQLRFSGWIQKVFADATYKMVRKGDPLFTVYSPEIAATEQEYAIARDNRDLLGGSTVPGVAAGSDFLLKAAAERLRQWQIPDPVIAQLESSGTVQRELQIDSPATGFITERNAFPSVLVQPGVTLYTIADLSNVWVAGQVLQSDVGRIKPGDPVAITTDAFPGRRFSGHVDFIYPQVDEATRTVKVRVGIANPEMKLALGMFVNLSIAAPLGQQLTIPSSGVFQTGTRQIAFIDHGSGYFEPREIETGAQAGDDVAVLSGLKAGDHVVTSANFLIDSESQLQAAMGAFAPPPPGAGAAAAMNSQPDQVTIDYSSTPSPPKVGTNTFRVKLTGTGGAAVTGAQVTVTFFMPAMPAMGMSAMRTVATLGEKGNGIYEGPGEVQMRGSWQVTIVASKNGQTLAQKQLDVDAGGSK